MQPQHPIATWNKTADRWETGEVDIFGHSAAYSVTLPKSGMTRNGRLYERPTSAPPTTAPASFLSPGRPAVFSTPDTMPDAPNSGSNMKTRPAGLGNQVKALPSPMTSDDRTTSATAARKSPQLRAVGKHFPTPKAGDGIMGRPRTTGRPIEKSTHLGTIVTLLPNQSVPVDKHLPTPTASDATGGTRAKGKQGGDSLRTIAECELSGDNTPPLFGGGSA